MIGRGIDQVMAQSVDPALHEPFIRSAEDYVGLATEVNGPIPRPVPPAYVWGAALDEIDHRAPDLRIVNLETTLTTSDAFWPGKEVLYRSHPANVAILETARIGCCALANNHVLDWGEPGLLETVDSLRDAGMRTIGAGRDRAEAEAPAIMAVPGGRVIAFAVGSTSSGIPDEWAATDDRPGVALVRDWSRSTVEAIAARLAPLRGPGDVVIVSIHWGSNWGYHVPDARRRFAHALVDAGVDVVHGHSSHHARGVELYNGRLIIHGCGDFITDYEGIRGYEEYRNDLSLAWFATVEASTGRLASLVITPFQLRRFQLVRPSAADVAWVGATLDRISRPLGTRIDPDSAGSLIATPLGPEP
jgi:poly-gamma-glutamate capsule biosynthesis protein CapA/YwtB (metallophosphatase superfamily)